MIIHGDYRDVLPTLKSESVAAVITDPPYGINYQNHYTQKRHDRIAGDETPFRYFEFAAECHRILQPNTALFAFTGWSAYPQHFEDLIACGFTMKEPLICQKRPAGTHDLYGSFQSNSDWVLFAHKGRFAFRPTTLLKNKRAGTVPNKGRKPVPEYKTRFPACWFGPEYPWSSENPVVQKRWRHPTVKSQDFVEWLIRLSTNYGDTVLDPFVGSGTTAAAAKATGRNFIGCEIDFHYFEMATERETAA